ncbi:DnaB-like helicase C-terminal domain-containing protein (plasmid) [Streptoverticillium reticulum]|uniref:DnaB-like helicase C-terminal domain-containing protein n=1 Tax=Streptoverticillium reticulum TaxID=1433415 RepID=UPI0039BF96D8
MSDAPSPQDPAAFAAPAGAVPDTTAAAERAPAALAVLPLTQDLQDVITHREIGCVTGPGSTATTAVERALAEGQVAPGHGVVWVRAAAPQDRSAMARSLYTALGLQAHRPRPRVLADTEELIAAELRRTTRLVIVPDAHQLRTTALQLLYGLWAHSVPDHFPLVLAGDDHLDAVLQRPSLASLKSCVFLRHRLPTASSLLPAPAVAAPGLDAAAPGLDAVAPAATPAAAGSASAVPDTAAAVSAASSPSSGPAPAAASAPAAAPGTSAEGAPAAANTGDKGPLLVSVARKRLYQLVDAARDEGRVVLVAKGRATAALAPVGRLDAVSRARLGSWPSWARTAARPKLGDLVVAASGTAATPGVPQVLLDRTTPIAVLVDAALLPAGDGPVVVPGGPDDAGAPEPAAEVAPAPTPAATAPAAGVDQAATESESDRSPLALPDLIPPAEPPAHGKTPPALAASMRAPVPQASPAPAPSDVEAAPGGPRPAAAPSHAAGAGTPAASSRAPEATASPAPGPAPVGSASPQAAAPDELARPAAPVPAPAGAAPVADEASGPAAPAAPRTPSAELVDEPFAELADSPGPGGSVPDGAAAPASAVVAPVPAGAGLEEAESVGPAQDAAAPVPAAQDAAAPDPSPRPRMLQRLDATVLDELLAPATLNTVVPCVGGPVVFGLPALDQALATLTPGRLTLIAAAPGAGGSLLAAAAARYTALTHNLPVLYAASGLTRSDVAARIVAAHTPVDYRRLRTNALTAVELEAAAGVRAQLASAPLLVDDGTGLTADAIAETVPDVEGLALVVVDRLQHAHDPAVPLSGPALPAAARTLAHLARTHGVPVLAVLDTDDPDAITALVPGLTLTLTRNSEDAQLAITERDFGPLATLPLHADLSCARFTDPPRPFSATEAFADEEGRAVQAELLAAARPFTHGGAVPSLPEDVARALALLDEAVANNFDMVPLLLEAMASTAARAPRLPDTAEGRRLAAALAAFASHAAAHGHTPPGTGASGITPASEALQGPHTPAVPCAGPSNPPLTGQAVTGPYSPATSAPPAGHDLPAAAAPQGSADPTGPVSVGSAVPAEPAPAAAPSTGPALAHTGPGPSTTAPAPALAPAAGQAAAGEGLEAAEAELLDAARPFLSGALSGLSARLTGTMAALRDARTTTATGATGVARDGAPVAVGACPEPELAGVLAGLRRTMTDLAARAPRLPDTPEGARLHTALAAYTTVHSATARTAPTPARTAPFAGEPPAAAPVPHTTPAAPGDRPAGPAQALQTPGDEETAASQSFQDTTALPEADVPASRTSARVYTFFLNKITAAVEQALEEAGGDMEAATKALVRKAVPDSMALFKLTRVGANYVHTVYPPALKFLSKPAQGASDEVWEGRHKWRNQPLADAIRKGTHEPLDVTALDTNAAFLSAFKTHLPIGALQHDPTGGFDRRRAGIHRVDHFEWPHTHLPSPLGNRVEPGPYYLDDATLRLLIRCHQLDLCEAPRILESWTSGASEGLLEKFRRVLQQARTTAIENHDKVTEEYVKAMYSRFTSTIGESGKNNELRRPEWVHTIRSQAFASLWLKSWKAHQGGLILVQVSGVDELHVAGGDWRQVFKEGRMPAEMKEKRLYTLGGK